MLNEIGTLVQISFGTPRFSIKAFASFDHLIKNLDTNNSSLESPYKELLKSGKKFGAASS